MNYFKKGEDPPLKPDSEYPDWLWDIAEPPPTLFNLQRRFGDGKTVDIDDDNVDEVGLLGSMTSVAVTTTGKAGHLKSRPVCMHR